MPKSPSSGKKKRTKGIPSEKGHNDTGDALQARLKAELASITQDQPDPKTKTMKQTQRDQQISQAFKRREQKLKEQSVLAAKLNKVLTKRVAAGESHVREVQRIVTVSRRPGYIDYGEEKKEDLRIVKEITDQIRACEREIESLNKELANTRMTEKNKQKKTIKSMNKYVNRARNERTGKSPISKVSRGEGGSIQSFAAWKQEFGTAKLTQSTIGQSMLSKMVPSRKRVKNFGIGNDGKRVSKGKDSTGSTSLGSTIRLGRLMK